ncbi:MAG: Asp23/Gls24 family envelope stress response protein [Firmicutes bacterium]|nr:Asp23/Gls24 family envelope stress response protein [Bacillota bacterium]
MENDKKGVIQISDEVISVIAAAAAREIDGVAKLVPLNVSIFGKKSAGKTKGVELEIKDGVVSANVNIMAHYNCKVRDVAQKVQDNIKNQIETMTGLNVGTVNVVVADIDFQKEPAEKAE